MLLCALCAVLAGCGPPPPPANGPAPTAPAADAEAIAEALRAATLVRGPRQATFGWELDEAGARIRGQGVARYVAPERFRLDLFGPRGETLLAAALVGDEARVPAAVLERFPMPSPALLWAAVGIVHAPRGAVLVDASTSGNVTSVRYRLADGDLIEFRARGERLESLRRTRGRSVVESVELTWGTAGVARALYRDWPAYRSLTLTVETHVDAAPFAETIWTPPGT